MDDQRIADLKNQRAELDPNNPDHDEIKQIIDAELFQLEGESMAMGGMVRKYNMGGMVMPTSKMSGRKFMKMGGMANKPVKMNKGGEISRGGRKSMQGLKFRGVK